MKYLNFGISEICEDKFNKINNTNAQDDIKPIGGLWFSKQDEEINNFNKWIDFIIYCEQHLFFYKYNKPNQPVNWEQPCALMTLKENANIYNIDSNDKYTYLLKNYPYNNNRFSYKELSKDYDGLYIDLLKINNSELDYKTSERLRKFGIDSLLLFNLNCIDYYQKGIVSIEPFGYGGYIEEPNYEIKINNEKKKVLKK